jgi:hypothetical protein
VRGTDQTTGNTRTDASAKLTGYIRALADQFRENDLFGVDPLVLVMEKKGREVWPLEPLSREIKKVKPNCYIKYIRCDTLPRELTMRGLFHRICKAPGREPMPDIVFFDGLEAITSEKNARIFARTFSFLYNERIRTMMSFDAARGDLVAEVLLRSRRRKARFLYLPLDEGELSSNRLTSIMDCLAKEDKATAPPAHSAPFEATKTADLEQRGPAGAVTGTTGVKRDIKRESEPAATGGRAAEPARDKAEAPQAFARAATPAAETAAPSDAPEEAPAADTATLRLHLERRINQATSVTEILDCIQETIDQLDRSGMTTHQHKMSRLYVKFIRNLIRENKPEEALMQFRELMRELDT